MVKGANVVFFYLCCYCSFSQPAAGLESKVSVHLAGKNLIEALDEISNQTGFRFAYNRKQLKHKVIRKDAEQVTLNDLLTQLLAPDHYFEVVGNRQIVILNETKTVTSVPKKDPGRVKQLSPNKEPISYSVRDSIVYTYETIYDTVYQTVMDTVQVDVYDTVNVRVVDTIQFEKPRRVLKRAVGNWSYQIGYTALKVLRAETNDEFGLPENGLAKFGNEARLGVDRSFGAWHVGLSIGYSRFSNYVFDSFTRTSEESRIDTLDQITVIIDGQETTQYLTETVQVELEKTTEISHTNLTQFISAALQVGYAHAWKGGTLGVTVAAMPTFGLNNRLVYGIEDGELLATTTRDLFWQLQVSMPLAIPLHDHMDLKIIPLYRRSIQSIYENNRSTTVFRNVGLNLALSFKIKSKF
ncbi:MAG: hypothetical protein AAF551_05525 [Bacteroidota bacterium]